MKQKMTIQELRALIKHSMINEVGSFSGGFTATGPSRDDVLDPNEIMTLRSAGFDVAGINPQNLTGEHRSALDWVAQGNDIKSWVPDDAMDADQLAAAGADYDVDGDMLSDDDGDANDDGVPDALEEDLSNLVANAAERLSVGQIVEFMLNALSDDMRGGFPVQEVISSVEKWSSMAAGNYDDMNESKTSKRWSDLAGLLKG